MLSFPAQAAAPIAQIQGLLAKPAVLCGRFDQARQLVGIARPLHSNGRFCMVAGKGILWRTLQPFPNTLRLTRDDILQIQGNRVAMRLDAKQEPVVRLINSVLFSLLAGDLSQLNKLFDLQGALHNKHWKVALKARDTSLAKAIGDIQLEGGQYVRKVTMSAANGDQTTIIFSAIKTGDTAMNTEEEALFEQKTPA